MSLPDGVYFRDGVPVYARDDRGPLRVFWFECGRRATGAIRDENQTVPELREWVIRWRIREAVTS